jgi:hypothetical protein
MVVWYVFPRFGILCPEKSGNPASSLVAASCDQLIRRQEQAFALWLSEARARETSLLACSMCARAMWYIYANAHSSINDQYHFSSFEKICLSFKKARLLAIISIVVRGGGDVGALLNKNQNSMDVCSGTCCEMNLVLYSTSSGFSKASPLPVSRSTTGMPDGLFFKFGSILEGHRMENAG